MNGLEIVIKNQKGFETFNELRFDCPACGKRKDVLLHCGSTTHALAKIEENPINQLICGMCSIRIDMLNYRFNSGNFGKFEKAYEELGWISKNPAKKIIRKIKSWNKTRKNDLLRY